MRRLSSEYSHVTDRLVAAGLRPTRQRVLLGGLLFSTPHRHVTAEALHREAKAAQIDVSLATVYNTLHQFTGVNLLREVGIEGGRSYFDTNTANHHHFFCEDSGELTDIPSEHITVHNLPSPPAGRQVSSVDIVIRLRGQA